MKIFLIIYKFVYFLFVNSKGFNDKRSSLETSFRNVIFAFGQLISTSLACYKRINH